MKQARRQKPHFADFYRRRLRSRKPGQSYVDLARQHKLKVKNLYQWASRFRNEGLVINDNYFCRSYCLTNFRYPVASSKLLPLGLGVLQNKRGKCAAIIKKGKAARPQPFIHSLRRSGCVPAEPCLPNEHYNAIKLRETSV